MILEKFLLLVVALVVLKSAINEADCWTPEEMVSKLTSRGQMEDEEVIQMLRSLDEIVKKLDENSQLRRLILSEIPEPRKMLIYAKLSIEKCERIAESNSDDNYSGEQTVLGRFLYSIESEQKKLCHKIEAQKQRHQLLSQLKSYDKVKKLAQAQHFLEVPRESLLQEFEVRLKRQIGKLSKSALAEAKQLSLHFREATHSAFEYGNEESYHGSVEVIRRYLESKSKVGSLKQARKDIFEACNEITKKLGGFLWILMENNKEEESQVNLSEQELRLISVTKICVHTPYDDLELKIVALKRLIEDTLNFDDLSNAERLVEELAERLKTFSIKTKDVYKLKGQIPEEDINRTLKKYLKSIYRKKTIKKNNNPNHIFIDTINEIEESCKILLANFGGFLYMVEDLKARPCKDAQNFYGRKSIAMTKYCKYVLTMPDGKLSIKQIGMLNKYKAKIVPKFRRFTLSL